MTIADTASREPAHVPPRREAGLVLPALVAGIICGFLAVVMSIRFASSLLPPELAAYLPVAAGPVVAWRLSREAMHRFQEEAPAAAFRLHTGLAAILAQRLASTDRLVRFLAD